MEREIYTQYLADDISKETIEDAAYFLLAAYIKMWKER